MSSGSNLNGKLVDALRSVLSPKDEVVVVFSGLWRFGHLLGVPARDVGRATLQALLEAVETRTLILPAYTNSFARSRRFDLVQSKPETGILPIAAIGSGLFSRTRNPMDSYLVAGPRSAEVLSRKEQTLWGSDSVMAWFEEVDARIIVLGEPWHLACSFFHYGEEQNRVPYRYYKRFAGTLVEPTGENTSCSAVMYVRPLGLPIHWNHTAVATDMKYHNSVISSTDSSFPVEGARAKSICESMDRLFAIDPFIYVHNKDELYNWIASGGLAAEISGLCSEERP